MDDPDEASAEAQGPGADPGGLRAALAAVAARDQLLSERSRQLRDLGAAAARLAAVTAQLEQAEAEIAALRAVRVAELAERDRRIESLEHRLLAGLRDGGRLGGPGGAEGGAQVHWERWFRERVAEREARGRAQDEETIRRLQGALEEKQARIATLLQRLQHLEEALRVPDDLKRIRGVGPVIEGLLHSIGVTTFEQVARLSTEDEARIGELLGAFRDRIRREGWKEQAAHLALRRVL